MISSNLAICVGPSVLWSTDPSVMMEPNYSKDVSSVMQLLIDEYSAIYQDNDGSEPRMFAEANQTPEATPSTSNPEQGQEAGSTMFVKGPNASKTSSVLISNGARSSGKSEWK